MSLCHTPGDRILITQHEQLDIAIKRVGNRYVTTMLIAKRIRQLNHGARARVKPQEGENHFSVAVREIAEGHVTLYPKSALPVSKTSAASDSSDASDETPASSDPTTQE
jgi:DNA-directed RNA polymerase omega subunit